MKTANELADIHCQNCTAKGDMKACLSSPCSVRRSWFAISQAAEIEQLKKERDALKADAERQEAKIKALRKSLNWALSNFSEEHFEWSTEEDADAHKEAMAAAKETT